MARLPFFWAALCLLGSSCGDESATVIGDAGAGGSEPTATGGSGGDPEGGEAGTTAVMPKPEPEPESEIVTVRDGDFNVGAPPSTVNEGMLPQIVSVTGPTAVTNGGSAVLRVQVTPAPVSPTFVVGLVGDSGYHTVSPPDPEGDGIYEISVQVAGEATQTALVFSVALVDAMGNVSSYREVTIEIVQSGTGDVKVTLSFDRLHDLDLHVVEPGGEEIYYERQSTATGGQLDLDSGAHCEATPANSENVFWPPGGAPAGEYRVFVQNYEQCSPGAISFTVRVAYDNVVNTYTNSFPDGTASEMVTPTNIIDIVTFTRGM
jgi:hypothetical protein